MTDVQQRAAKAQASQMNILVNTNEELEEAANSEQKTERNDDKVVIDDENMEDKVFAQGTIEGTLEAVSVSSDVVAENAEYIHVDVRL